MSWVALLPTTICHLEGVLWFSKIIYCLLSYLNLDQNRIFSVFLVKFTAKLLLFFEFSLIINSPIFKILLSSERLIIAFRNCFAIYGN